jgi:hypothetical protein
VRNIVGVGLGSPSDGMREWCLRGRRCISLFALARSDLLHVFLNFGFDTKLSFLIQYV